jgi:hypothetical protein
MTRILLLVATLAGCSRKVPPHLQLDPKPDASLAAVEIVDIESAVKAIIGRDPLARSPSLVDPKKLEAIPGGAPLVAFVRGIRSLEQGVGPDERVLQQLEDEWRATAVVPLTRGYRLRIAENQLANTLISPEERHRQVAALLTPLNGGGPEDPTLPRGPLDWLLDQGGDAAVRAYGDRWVVYGWLSDPAIPAGAVRDALAAPPYDGLRESEAGRLLFARATGQKEVDPASGLDDLRWATGLALQRAAADRDSEQTAWAKTKEEAAAQVGAAEPVEALLKRSFDHLVQGAGDDAAAGGALLASAALRWTDQCRSGPCTGLDRVETMQFASRWGDEVATLSAVWQVVALKESIDTLEVGRDTAMFSEALLDLSDALLGTGGGPLEMEMLRRRRPDPHVWLTVARAVGDEGITDWDGVRVALGHHLAAEARRAASLVEDAEWKGMLERIDKRAVP